MNVGVSVTVPMSVCRYDSLWYQKITPKVLGVGETEKKDFFFFWPVSLCYYQCLGRIFQYHL